MKTATQQFVLTPPPEEAEELFPGRTLLVGELPTNVRWWLVSGGVVVFAARRREP